MSACALTPVIVQSPTAVPAGTACGAEGPCCQLKAPSSAVAPGARKRTSKKTNKRLEEIATELGVDYILEGSVRKSGQRLRVAAQLIDAADETHLWAESYDYHLSDILTLQNTIADAIANQIELKLTLEKKELLVRPRRVAPGAHDAYVRGLYQLRKLSREGAEKAITHFEDATQKDASYALAYAGASSSCSDDVLRCSVGGYAESEGGGDEGY